jgi:hypothetical protein
MIIQYDKDGNELGKYKSVNEASSKTGVNVGSIYRVVKGQRPTAGGYVWTDESPELINVNENHNVTKSELKDLLEAQGLSEEDVKSVKIWQTMKGETRYSIVTKQSPLEMKNLKDDVLTTIKEASSFIPRWDYRVEDLKDPVAYEISLPDIHYGKITDESVEESERLYIKCITELMEKAKGLDIKKIILPIGNDGMNSEGYSRATTKGTPQQDSIPWRHSFRGYWRLVVEAINYLEGIAPVDVIIVQGNHDYERMFYAGEVLDAFFHNNQNVTVDNGYDIRKYYEFGGNMIMYCHGDKVKAQDMPLIMATEQPEMFARCKTREAHCGHVHKEMVNEYRGIKVRFIPSICANDDWHKDMGYAAMRAAQGHIWSETRGYEGYNQVNVK